MRRFIVLSLLLTACATQPRTEWERYVEEEAALEGDRAYTACMAKYGGSLASAPTLVCRQRCVDPLSECMRARHKAMRARREALQR